MRKSLIFVSLLSSFAFATGPSMVDARIQPLSINDHGALLYKYITTENPTGAHSGHPMIVGIGIFNNGEYTALTQEILEIDPTIDSSEAAYWAKRGQKEAWFNQACELEDLTDGFTACNTQTHHKDQWFTLTEFTDNYGIDLLKSPVITLHPSDLYASNQDRVYVEYEFAPFVLLQFKAESCFNDGMAELIVANTIMNDQANDRNSIDPVPFDCTVASAIVPK